MLGTTLADRYRINAELGRGGMGVVYQAEDTLLKRSVAIKVVTAAAVGTEGRARLLQEGQAAAGLNHPNIVTVYDVGQTPRDPKGETVSFIVMELVEGRSLSGYRPGSISQLVDLGSQMCAALDQAHQKGIIHRDLKPANVLLTANLAVKLTDFGLARVSGASRMTFEGALVGTVSYLAPEVILGQPSSIRSDLYALGVILYELATGRPPFQGDSPVAILSQHLHAPVVPPSSFNESLPVAIEEVVLGLLAKEPEKRPASAAEVRDALEGWEKEDSLDASATAAYRSQISRLVRGHLIGREPELKQLLESWQRAASGQGQVLLVSGEPGIGKTRLVRELTTYTEVNGATVLNGECYAGDDTPYLAITQMIHEAFENGTVEELPRAVLADLAALAPEVGTFLPEGTGMVPDVVQHRLLDSMLTLCRSLSAQRPLHLLVEDVHWADSGTVSILRHLARRLRDRPVLLVATYRGTELGEELPFQELLAELSRERLFTRVNLGRLSREQTGEMLATLFDEEITEGFLDTIYRETEGNPFFIEEVSRALIDSGEAYYSEGHWHRPELGRLVVPQGVRVAIQSRLNRLGDFVQEILQTASLLGREFGYEKLFVVAGADEGRLISALERAEEAQIIEEKRSTALAAKRGSGPTFSFTHALIQTTLVESLSTVRRQRMQRRIALALEEAFADELDDLAPMLGRFFAESGEGEKAVSYLLRGAERARQLFAFGEAARAYEEALVFLREGGETDRTARTLMKLGLVYNNLFEFRRSQAAYDEGLPMMRTVAVPTVIGLDSADEPLRLLFAIDPLTLDPSMSNDLLSGHVIDQLFSGLVEVDWDGELLPGVAERWEVLDGGRRYVFHLRREARWGDGEPVTAGDFTTAWRRRLESTAPGRQEQLYDIRGARAYREGQRGDPELLGVKALDDWTLQVDLEEPVGYFMQLMAHNSTFPVPQHQVEKLGDDWCQPGHLVGNGAYVIESWEPGQNYTLKRNPNYLGRSAGNIQEVRITVRELGDWGALYEADQSDILPADGVAQDEANRLFSKLPEEILVRAQFGTQALAFNTSRPPLNDKRIRQALALSLDRRLLMRELNASDFLPATGGFAPPGMPGHVEDIAQPFDPGRARSLLAEAGYGPGNRKLLLRISTSRRVLGGRSSADSLRDALSRCWSDVLGVELVSSSWDWDEVFLMDYGEAYEIMTMGWYADYPDPDNFLRNDLFMRYTGWVDQEFEELVNRARLIADHGQRLALYRRAEEILAEEVPFVNVAYAVARMLVKPWLKNIPVKPVARDLWKDWILEPRGK